MLSDLQVGFFGGFAEVDFERVAEIDEKELTLGSAEQSSLHLDLKSFCLVLIVAVFDHKNLGVIELMDIILLDLLDNINKVFVDTGQDSILIDGLRGPQDPLLFVSRR